MNEFQHITTDIAVKTFESAKGVFDALLQEIRELSKKKPDASLSKSKVGLINAVLNDLLSILNSEPEGKYLRSLDEDAVPQVSDALMMMVQFNAALISFRTRYFQKVKTGYATHAHYWITKELIESWNDENVEIDDDGEY